MKVMVVVPKVRGKYDERSIVVPRTLSDTAARKACRKAGFAPMRGQPISSRAVYVGTYLYDSQKSIEPDKREDSGRVYAALRELGKKDDEFVVERVVKVKPWSWALVLRMRADER
jgi:hypothetical protein